MSVDVQQAKKALRQRLRALLAAVSPGDAAAWSRAVCERILGWDEFKRAKVVMVYSPTPGEVDVRRLGERAMSQGKRVCLPRTDWEGNRIIPALAEPELTAGRHGIHEPGPQAAPVPLAEVDLVIVPGLGFDLAGNRIGRGAGLYDGFLADPQLTARTCAAAFDLQIVDSIPTGPLDIPVGHIATPTRLVAAKP